MLSAMLDIVYPRRCACCGCESGDTARHICWDCMAKLWPVQPPSCERCGNPVFGMVNRSFLCSFCAASEPAFDSARSAVHYDGPVVGLLHQFKYGGAAWLARDLGMLLATCVRTHFGDGVYDCVAAVPLHHTRERERTYNQSVLLADEVARATGRIRMRGALSRTRHTATQTTLTSHQRRENVRGAFSVKHPGRVDGRRFLLVDDVMTTGATVDECARVLKAAGAAAVVIATVARGIA